MTSCTRAASGVAAAMVASIIACVAHREEEVFAAPRTVPITASSPAPPEVAQAQEAKRALTAAELDDDASTPLSSVAATRALPESAVRAQIVDLAVSDEAALRVVEPLPHRKWIRHVRVPRESVQQIAARYGVALEDLREWNGLSEDALDPKTGRKLRVKARRNPPARVRIEYETVAGDSWHSIAVRHGVDAKDLRAYNWPYRHKTAPGNRLQIWVDPIVHEWISAGPDPIEVEATDGLRRGAVGIGPPDAGRLVNGVRIPDGEGYTLRLPRSAYGTTHAVQQLVVALAEFHERSRYGLLLELGAMSRAAGGDIGTHRSHQTGRDLDIRLPRREGVSSYAELTLRRVDWATTWVLVSALAEVDVTVIFLDYEAQRRLYRTAKAAGATSEELARVLQYPRGRAAVRGVVRHIDGHSQHLHVRFACGRFEPECVE